jgi:transglutaminase-like putative cysteine protease
MRYAIDYTTEYRYSGMVEDQHNAVRVQPASTPTQRVESFTLSVDPTARLHRYADYFGTEVIEFNVPERHDRLLIEARARVDRGAPEPPPEGSWQKLAEPAYAQAAGEFKLHTDDEPSNGVLDDLREAIRGDSPLATLQLLCQTIPERFEYRPGVTYVGSTVDDLLEGGAGVCQDFVHLSLILLRRHGIGARYVSGYLFAAPAEGEDSAEVNTHAWVEALVPVSNGDEPVWVGADPTNRTLAGEEHVKIGHGRFYGDVPPIKGVYRGPDPTGHDVRVTMTRL